LAVGILLLWMAFAPMAFGEAASALRVEIPEAATVTKETIRLRDVATVLDGPPAMVQTAGETVLGRAPLPGHTRRLRGRSVADRLERAGIPGDQVALAVPNLISVTRSAITLSPERVEALAREALEKRLANRPEAEVVSVRASRPAVLPDGGPVSARVEVRGGGDLLGTVPLTLRFEREGQPVGDASVTAKVAVFGDVVVARRPIPRHAPLGEDVLTLRRMDLADAPARHYGDIAELDGARAARRISAGHPLRPDLAEQPPAVERGDRIRILARKPGLEITVLGEVRTPGAVGERVRVVNVDSGKGLDARVLSADAVEVDF
jgi:flagella basal body P-ring formation protein FlgA